MSESRLEVRGSASEKFMLMMHDRIVALEARSDLHVAHISQLMQHVKELRSKRYNPIEEQFSDGALIDWYIWEPVRSMHVVKEGMLQLLDESHWKATVDLLTTRNDATHVQLSVPVSRLYDEHLIISMPASLTVEMFFTAIHAFYDTAITIADIEELRETGNTTRASLRISQGERVTWADLLGETRYLPGVGDVETSTRRHPFSCSGLVRYEGVQRFGDDLLLILGS